MCVRKSKQHHNSYYVCKVGSVKMSGDSSRSTSLLSLGAAAAPSSAGNSSTPGEWILLEIYFRRKVNRFVRWANAYQTRRCWLPGRQTPLPQRLRCWSHHWYLPLSTKGVGALEVGSVGSSPFSTPSAPLMLQHVMESL
jgi:hypothetical protein